MLYYKINIDYFSLDKKDVMLAFLKCFTGSILYVEIGKNTFIIGFSEELCFELSLELLCDIQLGDFSRQRVPNPWSSRCKWWNIGLSVFVKCWQTDNSCGWSQLPDVLSLHNTSMRYRGALPVTQLNMMLTNLYWILSHMCNQWRVDIGSVTLLYFLSLRTTQHAMFWTHCSLSSWYEVVPKRRELH